MGSRRAQPRTSQVRWPHYPDHFRTQCPLRHQSRAAWTIYRHLHPQVVSLGEPPPSTAATISIVEAWHHHAANIANELASDSQNKWTSTTSTTQTRTTRGWTRMKTVQARQDILVRTRQPAAMVAKAETASKSDSRTKINSTTRHV